MNNNTITQQGDSFKQFRVQRTFADENRQARKESVEESQEGRSSSSMEWHKQKAERKVCRGFDTLLDFGFNHLPSLHEKIWNKTIFLLIFPVRALG